MHVQAAALAPSMPAPENYLVRAVMQAPQHFWSLTDLSNVVAYVCRLSPTRIGIMFACLDDRLHRPRSGAQHADAPAVDFPALCGAKEFPVATGGRTRNSVSHSRRAELSGRRPLGATAKSRRGGKVGKVGNPPEAARRFALSHPGCSAVGNWQDASGNCGNCRNGSAGCCPQPWIPASGDQRFGPPMFFRPMLSRTWRRPSDHPQGWGQVSSHCHIFVIGQ